MPGAREQGARLRSDHAAADVATEVELEATLRGQRVRIVRAPEQERPKLRGDGLRPTEAHRVRVLAIDADGEERVLATRHEEARRELGALLGLDKAQFCQVVLLPQGGFAEFLRATSDKREALLRELFDVGRFADVEAWLKRERIDADRAAGAALGGVRDAVNRIAQAAEQEPPEGWEAAPDGLTDWLDDLLTVAEAEATTAKDACEQGDARRTAAAAHLRAAEELLARQQAHGEARAALVAWEAARAKRDAAAAELAAAQRAAPAAALLHELERRERAAREAEAAAEAARAAAGWSWGGEDDAGGEAEEAAAVELPEADAAGTMTLFEAATPAAGEERRGGGAGEERRGGGTGEAAALRARGASLRTAAGEARALLPREAAVEAEQQELERLRDLAAAQARRAGEAAEGLAALEARRPAAEDAVTVARAAVERLAELDGALARAQERCDHGAQRDRLHAELVTARSAAAAAGTQATAAKAAWLALWQRRLDGIAAELAGRLADGEACAVCGSLEHPSPRRSRRAACRTRPRWSGPRRASTSWSSVTTRPTRRSRRSRPRLRARRRGPATSPSRRCVAATRCGRRGGAGGADQRRRPRRGAGGARAPGGRGGAAGDGAQRRRGRGRRGPQRARNSAAARWRASWPRSLPPAVSTRPSRRASPSSRSRRSAPTTPREAVQQAKRCTSERDGARAHAHAAARDAGFGSVQELSAALRDEAARAHLDERVRKWDKGLVERRTRAEDPALVAAAAQPDPDVEALRTAAEEAAGAADAAVRAAAGAERRMSELVRLRDVLETRLSYAGPARERHALVREVATLADGSAASNRLKMRLSAYVLAARLEEVADAATVRLERMSGGRYALVHADDGAKGQRRGGLDLRVVDAWTGRRRSPSSLSGGETFLASLALALGLADVVTAEAGGARLETLFVDEGFGSLDDEGTLDEVLDVLDGLRDGGRVIGVVSHVAELRQRIPTQLRIERGITGSRVIQRAPSAAPAG